MIKWLKSFRKDQHPYPHIMKDGGCYCSCKLCVQETDEGFRCICKRCNENCTGMGRLGNETAILIERSEGYPEMFGTITRTKWYRK